MDTKAGVLFAVCCHAAKCLKRRRHVKRENPRRKVGVQDPFIQKWSTRRNASPCLPPCLSLIRMEPLDQPGVP